MVEKDAYIVTLQGLISSSLPHKFEIANLNIFFHQDFMILTEILVTIFTCEIKIV